MKKWLAVILAFALAACLSGALAQQAAPAVGDVLSGFEVTEISDFPYLDADVTVYTHQKTGAQVISLINEDPNRAFEIGMRTPTLSNKGTAHIFEHSVLNGSEKYPAPTIKDTLSAQTYNTLMNAVTGTNYTYFPIGSLSEAQLLRTADYYLDSVFHPMVLKDESLFREEGWRYTLESPESELKIAGTVYSEMGGALNINRMALSNAYQTLFPGSRAGYISGGVPKDIPQLDWQELKDYHASYYHPSNSLSILYGKIENVGDFLTLMDQYFSAYEPKTIEFADAGYTPIAQPAAGTFDFAVEEGTSTDHASIIYYAFAIPQATQEEKYALDNFSTLMSDAASPLKLVCKEKLPSASVNCYTDFSAPEFCVYFVATGVDASQSELLKQTVDELLVQTVAQGFDAEFVDAVCARVDMENRLLMEEKQVAFNIVSDIYHFWATGDPDQFFQMLYEQDRLAQYVSDGLCQAVVSKYLIGNPCYALTVTSPAPGLKEQQAAALQDELAGIKAGMTKEEIDQIVSDTAKAAQPDNSEASEYLKQLTAVTIDTLPEEARVYEVRDEMGEDGVRRVHAIANTTGVGMAYLLLDASGVEQENLLWYKLFISLLGELDTKEHTASEVRRLMTRYFYNGVIKTSTYDHPDDDGYSPYVRFSATALDEDMTQVYDLLYELLYETQFTDAGKIAAFIERSQNEYEQLMTTPSELYSFVARRAIGAFVEGSEYFRYTVDLDYYHFLDEVRKLLETEPETALAKLDSFEARFHNRTGCVSGYVGSEASAQNHRKAADAFLGRLDQFDIEKQSYSFAPAAASEAYIVNSAVQYNMIYAPMELIGLKEYNAEMDVVTTLLEDLYLKPLLRSQYGAYGAYGYYNDNGYGFITYRDPNIAQTFDVFRSIPQRLRELEIDQETLNGYILSAYSYVAMPKGELAGGFTAMTNKVSGIEDKTLEHLKQIKSLTVERLRAYADVIQKMIDNGIVVTAGSASVINQNAELYEAIYNPFGAVDLTQVKLSDAQEGDPAYAAIRYAYENELMAAKSDNAFGAQDGATLGDAATAMYVNLGGEADTKAAIEYLSGYDIVPSDGAADAPITLGDMADMLYAYYTAMGADMTLPQGAAVDPALPEAAQWAMAQGALDASQGQLDLTSPVTRAELAMAVYALMAQAE